ncbi:MAG: hypothetical protein ACYC9O_05810 [Candidatus Latescibacterota bacterium]
MRRSEHDLGEWVEKTHVLVEALEDVSKTYLAVFFALLAARICGQFLGIW